MATEKNDTRLTLAALQSRLRQHFQAAGIASAALDARYLIEGLSGLAGARLISAGSDTVDDALQARVDDAMALRLSGMPVHRILGHRSFYGLELALSPETLEPRPDTETLVDTVMPFARSCLVNNASCRILDLGTGTGAIGLALVAHAHGATCLGIDVSQGAVDTANANARTLGLDHVFRAQKGFWLEGLADSFDLIVSNPPYIPSADIAGLARDVRDHDPVRALDGGSDGLDPYRIIAGHAPARLVTGGHLVFEAGAGQGEDVRTIVTEAGFSWVTSHHDLAGHERVHVFQYLRDDHQ